MTFKHAASMNFDMKQMKNKEGSRHHSELRAKT
jgi:hypothetical protein